MALTERQLLLLSEFMYSDLAPSYEHSTVSYMLGEYVGSDGRIDGNKVARDIESGKLKVSGDFSGHPERLTQVMQEMHDDSTISRMTITKTTDEREGGIRAACFTEEGGDSTVAFRGTGGSFEQWNNNTEGFGDPSQRSQEDADAFIKSLNKDHLTVTGHSNGANQAMYSTVLNGDKIDRCICFEGQGCSKDFYQAHQAEVDANRGKITNISGNRDFVNPLMISPAGTEIFVESDSSLLFGLFDHGGFGLLSAFDETTGRLRPEAVTDQAWYCEALHWISTGLDQMSDMPFVGVELEFFTDTLGVIIGGFIEGKGLLDKEGLSGLFKTGGRIVGKMLENYVQRIEGHFQEFAEAWKRAGEGISYIWGKAVDWFESIVSPASTGGGGGSWGSGGGRANTIRVSTEDMEACISRYMAERSRLMDALSICNSASSQLSASWAGPSFVVMAAKLTSAYHNLQQTLTRIDDAIDELRATIRIMESTERAVKSSVIALDVGTSPFL